MTFKDQIKELDASSPYETFKKLNQYIPPHAPVMTSENYQDRQIIGNFSNYWTYPQAAYYANRPLIYSTDINEIQANRQHCAAYILKATNDPNIYQLAQKLSEKYKPASIEANCIIFLLNAQQGNGK